MKLTDVQKKLAEQLLLTVINRESIVEYNELASRINPPIFHRQVGREIGEISKLCKQLGLPLLSAKVVSKGSGKAGVGFYNLMKELGIDTEGKTEKELFSQELKKIRECKEWYKLADYLGIDLDLPRPTVTIVEDTSLNTNEGTTSVSSERIWIIPSNVATYDVISAFEKHSEIDWRQSANYEVGDVIYIYCAKPYQRIMHHVKVVKINIPYNETIDDKEFWINDKDKDLAKNRTYARLKLIQAVDSDRLSLKHLLDNGLKTAPQGPLKISGQLQNYIESVFKEELNHSLLPEELVPAQAETFIEGAKKQITINAYERNPIARSKCIQIHGTKCVICGFDFGAFYGAEFKGKIHVHHIKPLHLIDETYEVDPEHDLVPVCPNCHMVLHSKQDGIFTIKEVQEMIEKTKDKESEKNTL